MKPSELLKQSGWCQHSFARDSGGVGCHEASPIAVAYCIVGAILKIYNNYPDKQTSIFNKVEQIIRMNISLWNDAPGRTKQDVVALLESIDE